MDKMLEKALIKLVNEELQGIDVYLDKYQKVDFYVYSENIIKDILKQCKFKSIGNIYDHPNTLPQPDSINGFDLSINFKLFQQIAVSEKINSIMLYTIGDQYIRCAFLIDTEYLKKFSKITKGILQQDSSSNMFQEVDFQCTGREYIEVSNAVRDSMKPAEVVKKKVAKEQLVFVEGSVLTDIMKDINLFFKDDTRKMYEKMHILYKRGIILYGDPGNGKSAMIREIIRSNPKVSKIVLNSNIEDITRILSALIKSLDGKYAIVIIEDIDSIITGRNRSEFLNILDGVEVKSGMYFIGTTNYPDQIDPAFMNRSGRFDRTFEIENPSEEVRRAFYTNRNIGELLSEYKVYKDINIPDTNKGVVELFVKNSIGLPMASLKEIMTGTQYVLAGNPNMTIEEAVVKTYTSLIETKTKHMESHKAYKSSSQHNDFFRGNRR